MVFVALGCNRITPACAGKSILVIAWVQYCRDHPRMCGEKNIVRKASFDPQGSPPHVRGKGRRSCRRSGSCRITPACAGKSQREPPEFSGSGDHPRMCGEKSIVSSRAVLSRGSPPHVRGKAHTKGNRVVGGGITPACAGKRVFVPRSGHQEGDHPRMCGEKASVFVSSQRKKGSPPHVRGKGRKCMQSGGTWGITPACAGKSAI